MFLQIVPAFMGTVNKSETGLKPCWPAKIASITLQTQSKAKLKAISMKLISVNPLYGIYCPKSS